jgi:hypothetical protein
MIIFDKRTGSFFNEFDEGFYRLIGPGGEVVVRGDFEHVTKEILSLIGWDFFVIGDLVWRENGRIKKFTGFSIGDVLNIPHGEFCALYFFRYKIFRRLLRCSLMGYYIEEC